MWHLHQHTKIMRSCSKLGHVYLSSLSLLFSHPLSVWLILSRDWLTASSVLIPGGGAVVQATLGEALQPLTQAAEQAASSCAPENTLEAAALLARLSLPCAKLQTLMAGLAATQAQVLLHRAPEVGAFASQLKVRGSHHRTPLAML